MNRLQIRQHQLIKKLFEEIANKTIGQENICKVKLIIFDKTKYGCNWCIGYDNGKWVIGIELPAIKKRTLIGYDECYYPNRKLRVDKYVIHNKHNAIRFALYHELKHMADRITNPKEKTSEFNADGWAIKHLEGVK